MSEKRSVYLPLGEIRCLLFVHSIRITRCLGFGLGSFASSIHSSSALMKLQVPKIMHVCGCENVISVPSREHLFEGRTRRDIA